MAKVKKTMDISIADHFDHGAVNRVSGADRRRSSLLWLVIWLILPWASLPGASLGGMVEVEEGDEVEEAGEPPRSLGSVEMPTVAPEPSVPGDVLVIAGETIGRGEKRELRLATSESFLGAGVDTPLVVLQGEQPGPVLCLVAGIHGDELNGTEIVREILDTHRPADIKGTIIGIPIVNLFGFVNQSRYLPDRRDLNRYFPGREQGSTASRIAFRFWTVLRSCTHLVDFHTGSLHRSNLPQVRGDLRSPEILALSRAFGAPAIVHNPGQPGTLRRAASDHGIAAILYESGETMRFQKDEIRKGVLGVRNVMVHLGMRDGRRVDLGQQTLYLQTRWVRAEQGGILELYPSLGEWVTKGDILGVISEPLRRDRGVLMSPVSGRVIGLVLSPMVIPGMAVLHVGLTEGSLDASGLGMEELDSDRPE